MSIGKLLHIVCTLEWGAANRELKHLNASMVTLQPPKKHKGDGKGAYFTSMPFQPKSGLPCEATGGI